MALHLDPLNFQAIISPFASLSPLLSLSRHTNSTHSSPTTMSKWSPPYFFFCAGEEKTVCQMFRGGVTLAHAKCVAKHACVCMCVMKSVYWGIPLKGRSCNCVWFSLGGRVGSSFMLGVRNVSHEFQITSVIILPAVTPVFNIVPEKHLEPIYILSLFSFARLVWYHKTEWHCDVTHKTESLTFGSIIILMKHMSKFNKGNHSHRYLHFHHHQHLDSCPTSYPIPDLSLMAK